MSFYQGERMQIKLSREIHLRAVAIDPLAKGWPNTLEPPMGISDKHSLE